MATVYNKLVRDLIPDIISKDGKTPLFEVVSDDEYFSLLIDKVFEEADELRRAAASDPSHVLLELVDLIEVVDALKAATQFSPASIKSLRRLRLQERGGFKKKIKLVSVE